MAKFSLLKFYGSGNTGFDVSSEPGHTQNEVAGLVLWLQRQQRSGEPRPSVIILVWWHASASALPFTF